MKSLFAIALGLALGMTACHRHHLPHHHAAPHPVHPVHPVVVKPAGHTCHASCGHYHHGGKLYYAERHTHGANCGHTLRGGIWIRID